MNWRNYFRQYPELRTVIVNLKSGKAFRGVVWNRRGMWLVLKNAELLQDGQKPVPLDNETAVPVADVEFIQVL